MNIKSKIVPILLFLIVSLSLVLRCYKLSSVPPSLSWDEAAVGYNAFSIANYGIDEWGNKFPLVFKSFEDYKHPVHIYTTAFFVKLFGLSDFSTRIPSALFGVFNVILLFFLGRALFKSDLIGIAASFILAISPYNLQFSRFNHELNLAVFWFILGLVLFYRGIGKRRFSLPLSFAAFGISLLTYHSAKIVVPLIVIALILLYRKELISKGKEFILSLAVLGIFVGVIVVNPQLLGTARLKQTGFSDSEIQKTYLFAKTGNRLLGRVEIVAKQYSWHFKPQFLFVSGDKNLRHSTQVVGEFYKIDAPFLLIGALAAFLMILKRKSRESLILLLWALLAPVPSAFVNEAPHAARAMFMTGSWHTIAALGFVFTLRALKDLRLKMAFSVVLTAVLGYSVKGYLTYYYREYSKRYAIEWQYGMKEIVGYLKSQKNVGAVYMTNVRQQPYIFFLYYLKYPSPQFLDRVKYNNTLSKSFSTVSSFAKYHFLDDMDFTYSPAGYGIYYVLTGPEYDGLFYRNSFEVKEIVKYPNGSDAFYIVTAKDIIPE